MNDFLWTVQTLLAVHTVMGAVWKFSNSAQTVPSLKAIPHELWLAIGVVELLCALGLIVPVFKKSLGILAPIAATCIAAEMLFFCGLHFYPGDANYSHPIYWLIVAGICAFVAYGRFALEPIQSTLGGESDEIQG